MKSATKDIVRFPLRIDKSFNDTLNLAVFHSSDAKSKHEYIMKAVKDKVKSDLAEKDIKVDS